MVLCPSKALLKVKLFGGGKVFLFLEKKAPTIYNRLGFWRAYTFKGVAIQLEQFLNPRFFLRKAPHSTQVTSLKRGDVLFF